MIAADEDALICDLAETYGIFAYRALPVKLLATLASGLRADSRIKMILAGTKASEETLLLAGIADRMGQLVWMQSMDGSKGKNRPKSILSILLQDQPSEEDEGPIMTFETAEQYEAAMAAAKRCARGGEENSD